MVSAIDDRLHGLWTRPGQTLRGRVNHRAREPPEVLLELLSQRITQSCGDVNIIVIIMNLWNCRFSVIKSKAAALSRLIGTAYSDLKCGLKTASRFAGGR